MSSLMSPGLLTDVKCIAIIVNFVELKFYTMGDSLQGMFDHHVSIIDSKKIIDQTPLDELTMAPTLHFEMAQSLQEAITHAGDKEKVANTLLHSVHGRTLIQEATLCAADVQVNFELVGRLRPRVEQALMMLQDPCEAANVPDVMTAFVKELVVLGTKQPQLVKDVVGDALQELSAEIAGIVHQVYGHELLHALQMAEPDEELRQCAATIENVIRSMLVIVAPHSWLFDVMIDAMKDALKWVELIEHARNVIEASKPGFVVEAEKAIALQDSHALVLKRLSKLLQCELVNGALRKEIVAFLDSPIMKADGIQAIVGGALASEANDFFKPVLEFIKNELNTIAVSASAEKAKLDEISKGVAFDTGNLGRCIEFAGNVNDDTLKEEITYVATFFDLRASAARAAIYIQAGVLDDEA